MTEKRHGKGLLFIVTLVLAAGVIKYADIPFAQTVREKAASALSGAANADHVLAVFGGSAMPADTVPAESSGGADDILDRAQTLFPDTVDQTVYPLEFEHATPTSGTLTSSFGSRLSPITGAARISMIQGIFMAVEVCLPYRRSTTTMLSRLTHADIHAEWAFSFSASSISQTT